MSKVPPITPESIAAAKAEAEAERILADLSDQIVILCETYGYQRVARIVRNAAHLAGQEV